VLALGLILGLILTDGERDEEGETLTLALELGEVLALGETLGDALAEGD